MNFIEDVVDLEASEINVDGVASVECINADMVRVTYYMSRKGEKIAAIHLVWGLHGWLACLGMWDQTRDLIAMECAEFARVAHALASAGMN